MGTNFYMFSQNKQLMKQNFPSKVLANGRLCDGAELVDEPDFGYQVHLCKLSCGWLPLFEYQPETFKNFTDIENFYVDHQADLKIFDEYGTEFTWDEFKDRVVKHSQRDKEPMKWVYDIDPVLSFMEKGKKSVHLVRCEEEDNVDIYSPFRHDEYTKSYEAANRKFYQPTYGYEGSAEYYRDDKYDFDWTFGTFS